MKRKVSITTAILSLILGIWQFYAIGTDAYIPIVIMWSTTFLTSVITLDWGE